MSTINNRENSDSGYRPPQRIAQSKKVGTSKDAEDWRIASHRYFSRHNDTLATYKTYMKSLFRVASGYLDVESYKFVTNPLNTDKDKYAKRYSNEVNNYDIITPILMMFLGDKIDRSIKPTVAAINSDIDNVKLQEKTRLINEQLDKIIANGLREFNNSNVPEQEVLPEKKINEIIGNIKDQKAISGAKALEYIMVNNEIPRKFRKNFYNWIVTYCCFSVRNVLNKDIEYDVIPPHMVNYTISDGLDFIEDGENASVVYDMTVSEIIDRFHDQLKEKDLVLLESETMSGTGSNSSQYDITDEFYNSMVTSGKIKGQAVLKGQSSSKRKVTYCNWKSMVKIGKLEIEDGLGNIEVLEVDEDFKPREDEKVEWVWVNQVWEGWDIDDQIFFGQRPIPFQRGKLDNPSACKLLINGRVFMNSTYRTKSIVERLLPYQKKYNVISFHLEKVINKNKDKIIILPYGLIPDNENIDIFDMMYYADKDSYLFVDDSDSKKAAMIGQNIKVLDMSLSDNMRFLSEMLRIIKSEAEEAVGINRQRLGNVNSSDGKGANEDAIQRSSIITSEIFEQYEEFEEREWQCLLDLSKFAWKDGKKATYTNSNQRQATLEVDREYSELEFGVQATRSSREIKKLDRLRSQNQAMIQNGAAQSTLAKMENADSVAEIEEILLKAEAEMNEGKQKLEEVKQQGEQQKAQILADIAEKDREFNYYKTDSDNATREKVAIINSETSIATTGISSMSSGGVEKPQSETTSPSSTRSDDLYQKNEIEREKLNLQNKKLQIEREKMQTQLKNKVVGEK